MSGSCFTSHDLHFNRRSPDLHSHSCFVFHWFHIVGHLCPVIIPSSPSYHIKIEMRSIAGQAGSRAEVSQVNRAIRTPESDNANTGEPAPAADYGRWMGMGEGWRYGR